MKRLIPLLLLAGCSARPQADLQYVKQARSIAAEWALLNQQAEAHRLTGAYVSSMRGWLRDGLSTASSSLSDPDTAYGGEMRRLLAEPPDAAPETLRAHAEALKRIEDALESA